MFGVKGLDNKGIGLWDPEKFGKIVIDEEFSATTILSQYYIINMCD